MTTIPAPVVLKANRRVADKFAITLLGASVVIIVAILVVIVGNIVIHGVRAVTWEFITQAPRQGLTAGGIMPAIVGTAALVILMSIVAVPLGVATRHQQDHRLADRASEREHERREHRRRGRRQHDLHRGLELRRA